MAKKKPTKPAAKPPAKKPRKAAAPRAPGKKAAEAPAKPPTPAALTREQLAELLTKAGGRKITAADVAAHVKAGAPTHADGTLHLVHYAAWLAAQVD